MTSNSASSLPESVDLAIIGGGPSGSTLASLVAAHDHSVVILEKDSHPRFHIGESLLPHNLRIFRRLGILDQVKAIGVHKAGVDFTSDEPDERAEEIRFCEALDLVAGCEHAYQVRRSEFDRLLFDHARHSGAHGLTGARVRAVDFDQASGPELTVEHGGGSHRLAARFVVDASGRDSFLARRFKFQQRNREHGTAALYGHYEGVPRRPGDSAGNISIYWFDQGWIWMIPLPDGVMSIGAVCNPDYLRHRGEDVEGFFRATVQRNPHAWRRMQGGDLVSPVTATGNYSYSSRRIDGERWLMIGDAGMFVDPVFSSGVFFSMNSAELGAEVVLAELAGDRGACRRARRRFRSRVRRGVRELSWFIYRFPAPATRRLFLGSGSVLGMKEAVISVLAGDLYDNRRIYWRIRLFRLVHALVSLADFGAARRFRRQRRHNAGVVFDRGV